MMENFQPDNTENASEYTENIIVEPENDRMFSNLAVAPKKKWLSVLHRGNPFGKTQWVLTSVFAVILAAGIFTGGFFSGRAVQVDQMALATVTHEKRVADTDLADKQNRLTSLKSELQTNETLVHDMKEYEKNKETLTSDLSEKQAKVDELDGQISQKQDELNQLTGQVLQAKSEPKTLPSGEFIVGTDLQPGRYKVSGSSNFVVYSITGKLKVNTILGNSSVGDGDYVCNLSTGDEMKLSSRTTFTPLQ